MWGGFESERSGKVGGVSELNWTCACAVRGDRELLRNVKWSSVYSSVSSAIRDAPQELFVNCSQLFGSLLSLSIRKLHQRHSERSIKYG